MASSHYFLGQWVKPSDTTLDVDVCVYGGTASGVAAAVAAARRGRSVVLLHPGTHLGGMTTGGLGLTDIGNKYAIGGMARQFYRDVGKLYGEEETWRFSPHRAMAALNSLIDSVSLDVRDRQFLKRAGMGAGRIVEVEMLGGLRVRAKMFIDATYEGDLLAAAGVSFTVGRESNSVYGETLNGAQIREYHQFGVPVDPYVVEGDASSGLLPHVVDENMTRKHGQGDRKVQAYNFRVCMTNDPSLRIAWSRPAGFDPRQMELATRWYSCDRDQLNDTLVDPANPMSLRKFDHLADKLPGGYVKTDTNNHGPVSSDFIGGNWGWPEGDYELRERLFQAHVTYQQGLYWHIANEPTISKSYRDAYSTWGLARDEFEDTGNWPHQLYVREGRRMVSDAVITEHVCLGRDGFDDAVGMGAYSMDSHNCCRFVRDGRIYNEGDVQVRLPAPYVIPYRSIVPKRGECGNLFVPVCLSASHIAFGSVRMEPVFMILGESAAIAADMCLREGASAQDLPYAALREELVKAGQVLAANVRND